MVHWGTDAHTLEQKETCPKDAEYLHEIAQMPGKEMLSQYHASDIDTPLLREKYWGPLLRRKMEDTQKEEGKKKSNFNTRTRAVGKESSRPSDNPASAYLSTFPGPSNRALKPKARRLKERGKLALDQHAYRMAGQIILFYRVLLPFGTEISPVLHFGSCRWAFHVRLQPFGEAQLVFSADFNRLPPIWPLAHWRCDGCW